MSSTSAVVASEVESLTNEQSGISQEIDIAFYGSADQPGFKIQVAIFNLVNQGFSLKSASAETIEEILTGGAIISDPLAFAAISERKQLTIDFVHFIAQLTSPLDATKEAIQNNPQQLEDIITLGITLYPQNARDILNAATMTGEISINDAFLIAIGAGLDPTLIASSTAAGGIEGTTIPLFSVTPLGSGIGAGGTGGGDTTASTN